MTFPILDKIRAMDRWKKALLVIVTTYLLSIGFEALISALYPNRMDEILLTRIDHLLRDGELDSLERVQALEIRSKTIQRLRRPRIPLELQKDK